MINRPFAYNPTHNPISGTTQHFDLAIGVDLQEYSKDIGGIRWWSGPDEDLGYIICAPVPEQNQPTPLGNIGSVKFWRSKELNDISFLNLIFRLSNTEINNIEQIKNWLNIKEYWSSWDVPKFSKMKIASSDPSFLLNIDQVWAWGKNVDGSLGDNTTTLRYTPVSILGNKKTFCEITVGERITHSIDYNGQVWGWGSGNNGGLGDNSITSKLTPVSIHGNKKTFCQISNGNFHSIVLDKSGQIWSWGYNLRGQLGDNTVISKRTPISLLGSKKTFCKIGSGYLMSSSIDYTGQIWTWGNNTNGQLGDNSIINRCTPVSIHGNKKTFCEISTGRFHNISIDNYGQIWGWGYNNYGQIGDNTNISRITPVSIHGYKKTFCYINCYNHNLAIDKYGQVWSWGINGSGQLGIDETNVNIKSPTSIHGSKKTFCKINAGQFHTIAIDVYGQLWGWGNDTEGRLGFKHPLCKVTPVSILGNKKTFCKISSDFNFTLALDQYGQIWSWGYNEYGQLGTNSLTIRKSPFSTYQNDKLYCCIYINRYNSIALDDNGQIWTWGYNHVGQLGINSNTSRLTPVSILGNKKTFCKISSGEYFSSSIDANGQIWNWGINNYGQLGDNSITNKSTPISIMGNKKTFCNISGGVSHGLAIEYNGQIWSWGLNWYGQLGINLVGSSRVTPVSILGSKKTFCQISTYYNTSMSLDNYGQIWCWGQNSYGELGINSTDSTATPVSILGYKKTFCQISSGYYHSMAIDYTGKIWCWGYNHVGQLGDNSTISRLTPVIIYANDKTFCNIKAGNNYSMAIDQSGQIWGWGYNQYYQLGIGFDTSTPIKISNF